MLKKLVFLIVVFAFMVSLSGCATAVKKKDLEIQDLKGQISNMETQIQSRDQEINDLRGSLNKMAEEKLQEENKKRLAEKTSLRPSVKQIQVALQNAGYNPGAIDAKLGPQTVDAIKAFQQANNLDADGKVGRKTWIALRKYLYKKTK